MPPSDGHKQADESTLTEGSCVLGGAIGRHKPRQRQIRGLRQLFPAITRNHEPYSKSTLLSWNWIGFRGRNRRLSQSIPIWVEWETGRLQILVAEQKSRYMRSLRSRRWPNTSQTNFPAKGRLNQEQAYLVRQGKPCERTNQLPQNQREHTF